MDGRISSSLEFDMDARISSSLGAMGSILWKLEFLTTEQSIQQLGTDLLITRTRLANLSKVKDPPLTAKYWMKDVRELSYDMEDCVDQFAHAGAGAKMDWIHNISGFRARVEEANQRYERYKLDCIGRSCRTNIVAIHDHRLQTLDDHVGTEGPMNELERWLNGEEKQLKVVSVVGVGGVGKTTLAQKLWRKLGEQFECRAFVQTAKKPDMKRILRTILSQVHPQQPLDASDVHNLIGNLSKYLLDKRYFIVVDDVWSTSVWDVVSRAFPKGNHGSRILTTTKFEEVALACCGYQSKCVFKMKPLSDDLSKELFISTIFGSGKDCPQQYSDISDKIRNKCGNLPLALTSIANLLVIQPEAPEHWKYVQNFLDNNLRADPNFDDILKQVLNLCYNSLPDCLKTCLLYFSTYPENYTILKEDLVKQWLAEGFVCATEGEDIMKVACRYFDMLVNLGLIQCMDINNNDKVLQYYVVQHMILDIVTHKSIEENFITVMDYSQTTVGLSDKVRRLSLHFGSATYATIPAGIGLSQIRSLSFIGLFDCLPSIVEFKLLRVLILDFWGDHGNPNFNLGEICELFLLRYLKITCNVTVELPDQMQRLKHLETLEISARAVTIPSDIVHLSSLVHLRLRVEINPQAMINPLDDLIILSPPRIFLQTFELLPPICIFSRLPKWTGELCKLRILNVVVSELLSNDIDILAGLPVLTVLSLYIRQPAADSLVFNRAAFPVLECLNLSCGILYIAFQEEALPKLQRLMIGFNAHRGEIHGNMLSGIEHLINLQDIDGQIGAAAGAEDSDWRAAESAFKNAISKHSRLPRFNIRRVEFVEEEIPHVYHAPASSWPSLKSESEASASGPINPGKRTTSAKLCGYPGCEKGARGASGRCIAHDRGRRCEHLCCTKSAEGRTDLCIAHGGGRRCSHEGCSRAARGKSGLCIKHGGGKRCQAGRCTRSAEGISGVCILHGGGRRCTFSGCHKGAQGSTPFCKGHGGGKRCSFQGSGVCTKSVHGGTQFCVAHGGGKRCAFPGCTKSARGRTEFCVDHGGGKRCRFDGCGKSLLGGTDFCKAHGGGKRCTSGLAGSSVGVSGPGKQQCGRFAQRKTGLYSAHSALTHHIDNLISGDGSTFSDVIDQFTTDVRDDEMELAVEEEDGDTPRKILDSRTSVKAGKFDSTDSSSSHTVSGLSSASVTDPTQKYRQGGDT